MTKANIRESIQARLGLDWVARNKIEPSVIDDMIVDEYEKMAGDTMLLEGSFTGTTDGVNPYMELNEEVMLVKAVWYDYTANSDWGDELEEVTPMDINDEFDSGDPEFYWIQSMHRYNRQRLYFDKLPEAGVTVRALFFKWPDGIASDTEVLEIKRLWAKALKHIVTANLCVMGTDREQNKIKEGLAKLEMANFQDTMRVVNSMPKRAYSQAVSVYRDLGF